MRFSGRLYWLQPFFVAVILTAVSPPPASADRVIAENGDFREGEIVGVTDGTTIRLNDGRAEIGLPIDRVARVEMDTPEEFTRAMEAYEAGETAEALALVRPLVDRFAGLPAEWTKRATGTLGDIYLALDKFDEARDVFAKYQELYPEGEKSDRAEVGMARIALAEQDYDTALERVKPIAERALQTFPVSDSEGATFGQAFLILGQIREENGEYQDALQEYLRTVTIFPQDRKAADKAMELAEALKEAHDLRVP